LAYAVSIGPQDPAGDADMFTSSLVFKHQLTCRLGYVMVHSLGYVDDGVPVTGDDGEWYGINQYFKYKLNKCCDLNLRFEWFRDDDGAILRGIGTVGRHGWDGAGFAGNFYALTLGATWKPCPNVMVRPECRWDWYDGERGVGNELPFGAGTEKDQFLLATDVIFTY
jgi:hypothetical protein